MGPKAEQIIRKRLAKPTESTEQQHMCSPIKTFTDNGASCENVNDKVSGNRSNFARTYKELDHSLFDFTMKTQFPPDINAPYWLRRLAEGCSPLD